MERWRPGFCRPVLGLGLALALAALAADASAADGCPADSAIAARLQLAGTGWLTACRREPRGGLLLAALMPPQGSADPPKLVVALARTDRPATEKAGAVPGVRRVSLKLASTQEKRVGEATAAAEQWTARIERSRLGGENLVRVTLTGSWGGNQLYTQDIVTLLRETPAGLTPLWTGLGDWTENRFDICLLSGRATFRLTTSKLDRLTRVTRRRGRAPLDEAPARQVQKECLPHPPQQDTFALPPSPA